MRLGSQQAKPKLKSPRPSYAQLGCLCALLCGVHHVLACVRVGVRVYVNVWWRSRVDGVWFVVSGVWSMVCWKGECRCVVRGVM